MSCTTRFFGPALAMLVGCASGSSSNRPDAGDDSEASISGVIPGEVFVGRGADVLIIGSGTSWTDGVTVDLGDGVTVDEVSVASPTALLVKVSADATARLGARDVTVDDLTYAAGFELVTPLQLNVQGVIAQGSLSFVRVTNLDLATPFDTTIGSDGGFPNIQVKAGEGTSAQLESVEPYSVEMLFLVDVDAATGPQDLEVLSGPPGQEVLFRFPGAFDMFQRQPMPLTPGRVSASSVDEPFESLLYSIAPGERSLLMADATAQSAEASPRIAVLPASGSFDDLIVFGPAARVVSDQLHYLVYWDNAGVSGYDFAIQADAATLAASLPEGEPNNVRAEAALVATTPAAMEEASFDSLADEDWVRFDLTADDLRDGKIIRAVTFGDDPLTDTVVTIFRGTTELAASGDSDDFGVMDEVSTALVTAAGSYFVRVTASPFLDMAHTSYGVAVLLEDP
jgi:hypothetical protein